MKSPPIGDVDAADLAVVAEADSMGTEVAVVVGVHPSSVYQPYDKDPEFFQEFTGVLNDKSLQRIDDLTDIKVMSDQYIGIELALPQGDEATR